MIYRRLLLGSVLFSALSVPLAVPASAEIGWWSWLTSPTTTSATTTRVTPRWPASTVSTPRVAPIHTAATAAPAPRYAQLPFLVVGVGF